MQKDSKFAFYTDRNLMSISAFGYRDICPCRDRRCRHRTRDITLGTVAVDRVYALDFGLGVLLRCLAALILTPEIAFSSPVAEIVGKTNPA